MSQEHPQKPAKQLPVPPPGAEPGMAPSPFFAIPSERRTGGELVVPQQQSVIDAQQHWAPSPQPAAPVASQSADSASRQSQGVAAQDRARLQRLCSHLRRTGGCPGQCVLSRARQDRRLRGFGDIR